MSFRSKIGWIVSAAAASLVLATPARAEPPMWVVKDKDSTIYLFGTVHVLKPDMKWDSPKLQAAIKDSSELWLEVLAADDPAASAPFIQKYGLDPAKPLSKKLTPEQLAKVDEVGKQYGLSLAAIDALQPWFAAITFTVLPLQKAGFDPKLGVDSVLKGQATKDGDKLMQLETLEQQLGFLAGLSEAEQVQFLMQSVEDAGRGAAVLEKLATAWQKGDVASMEADLVAEMRDRAPQVYDLLITKRNVDWAGKIQTILAGSGTHLIAVGAGHLIGPDSVQAQLKARGVKSTRIQ